MRRAWPWVVLLLAMTLGCALWSWAYRADALPEVCPSTAPGYLISCRELPSGSPETR